MNAGLTATVAGGVLAAGAVAGVALGWNELLTPLVPPDLSELITPLVPQDAGGGGEEAEDLSGFVESLVVPGGTDLATAYRLDIRWDVSGGLVFGPVFGFEAKATDAYSGDMVHVGEGIYEGKLLYSSTGSAIYEVAGGRECTSSWSGEQVVEVVGEVVSSTDPGWSHLIESPDHDSFYVVLRFREIGAPRYTDPKDCDEGDDPLHIGARDDEDRHITSTIAVRLPPSGFGKVEERGGESVAGVGSYEWVAEIVAIPPAEASPDMEEFAATEASQVAASVTAAIRGGAHEGSYAGEAVEDGGCVIGGFTQGLSVTYYAEEGAAGLLSLSLLAHELEKSGSSDDFFFDIALGSADDPATFELIPIVESGSGTASLEDRGGTALVRITGETSDGIGIDVTVECHKVTRYSPAE